jgi:hypothetical protein
MIRLTIVIFLLAGSIAVSAAPGVKIKNDTFDFGKVIQNSTTTHSFWIKSTGSDTLRITEIDPGCGCTQMPLRDSVLGPGDSTRLDIIFTTRSYVGHVNKRPYIMTNASTEKVGLSIYAEIMIDPENAIPLVPRPARIDVSQFSALARRRASFKLFNKSNEDVDLQCVDTSFKSFEVVLPSKIKAGETAEGTIVVKKDKVPTSFKESFTFEAVNDNERDVYSLVVERMYHVPDSTATGSPSK